MCFHIFLLPAPQTALWVRRPSVTQPLVHSSWGRKEGLLFPAADLPSAPIKTRGIVTVKNIYRGAHPEGHRD